MFKSIIKEHEVYVYHNGSLIYKRWNYDDDDKSHGIVFTKYGPNFRPMAQDNQKKQSRGK